MLSASLYHIQREFALVARLQQSSDQFANRFALFTARTTCLRPAISNVRILSSNGVEGGKEGVVMCHVLCFNGYSKPI